MPHIKRQSAPPLRIIRYPPNRRNKTDSRHPGLIIDVSRLPRRLTPCALLTCYHRKRNSTIRHRPIRLLLPPKPVPRHREMKRHTMIRIMTRNVKNTVPLKHNRQQRRLKRVEIRVVPHRICTDMMFRMPISACNRTSVTITDSCCLATLLQRDRMISTIKLTASSRFLLHSQICTLRRAHSKIH